MAADLRKEKDSASKQKPEPGSDSIARPGGRDNSPINKCAITANQLPQSAKRPYFRASGASSPITRAVERVAVSQAACKSMHVEG
jgi:hypothetical protein